MQYCTPMAEVCTDIPRKKVYRAYCTYRWSKHNLTSVAPSFPTLVNQYCTPMAEVCTDIPRKKVYRAYCTYRWSKHNLTWVAPGFPTLVYCLPQWSWIPRSCEKTFFCGNKWLGEVSNLFTNIWSVNTSHQLLHCFIYQKLVSFTYAFPWVFRPWT